MLKIIKRKATEARKATFGTKRSLSAFGSLIPIHMDQHKSTILRVTYNGDRVYNASVNPY